MERLKYSDIKNMDDEAIERKLSSVREGLFANRMEMKVSGIEKPHLMKLAKSNIAKLMTEKNYRKKSAKGE
jgi:ribosomal protein L29